MIPRNTLIDAKLTLGDLLAPERCIIFCAPGTWNGKTFASGESHTVKTALRTATIRCLSVGRASARIKIDGVDAEQELQLLKN